MIIKVLIFCFVALFALVLTASVSDVQNDEIENLTQQCLDCICRAATNCNASLGCQGDVCGPFLITQDYWSDAGKPLLHGQTYIPSASDTNSYANCVNDRECATRTVQGYMSKFSTKDCNHDGKIDCDDFVRVHFLGGYGCSGNLQPKHNAEYAACTSKRPTSRPSQPTHSMQQQFFTWSGPSQDKNYN